MADSSTPIVPLAMRKPLSGLSPIHQATYSPTVYPWVCQVAGPVRSHGAFRSGTCWPSESNT